MEPKRTTDLHRDVDFNIECSAAISLRREHHVVKTPPSDNKQKAYSSFSFPLDSGGVVMRADQTIVQ